MLPLVVLFEGSILLAALLDRARAPRREEAGSPTRDDGELDLTTPTTTRPMLFDLRGSGRRRTVKIVYISLAVPDGRRPRAVRHRRRRSVSGGLVDAITGLDGGGDTGTDALQQARAGGRWPRPARNPKDPAAWAALARARFQLAGAGDNFDQTTRHLHGEPARRSSPSAGRRVGAAPRARPEASPTTASPA